MLDAAALLGGLVLLVLGAEALVRGAAGLAARLGISPLIIGLTVVAFGTSTPELAISVAAVLSGNSDIAFGNVVGSNIFNVLFILGLSALITPLVVSQRLVRIDVPLMIGMSAVTILLALDHRVGHADGIVLVLGLAGYLGLLGWQGRRETAAIRAEYTAAFGSPRGRGSHDVHVQAAFALGGLALLVMGSRWFVTGAAAMARALEVSELIIGLTIVAAGTSLPEVATSLVAAVRGERDIAVGNVVGSNLFNLLGVLGVTSMVAPDGILVSATALRFDLPVMLAVAAACLPIFFTGNVISRWEGAVFLTYYVIYAGYLVLDALGHAAASQLRVAMLSFVIPLTVLTLAVVTARALSVRRGGSGSGRGR